MSMLVDGSVAAPSVETVPGSGTVVASLVARRAVRSAAPWAYVFAAYLYGSISGYAATYKTPAARLKLARSLAPNAGLRAIIGPARHLETVVGFAAWRCLGVLTLVGGASALLASTRLLRGEEDAGRWELLLAGQTTRRRAAGQGLAGLAAGWTVLLVITALVAVVDGMTVHPRFAVSASLFFALSLLCGAALFLAIGALTSQLAATRRQAASLAGGVLGLFYLMRMVADSGSTLRWLIWLTPLGWIEELRPLTGSRPIMLVPIVSLVVVVGALTLRLAGERDAGSSILPDRDSAPPRTALLDSPTGLTVRLVRPVGVAWTLAIGFMGLLFGLVAQSAANAASGSASVEKALARLGGKHGGAAAYLGLTFVVIAALVALVGAGQIVAAREEEAEGRLDNLLVRPVARWSWLAGRLLVATAITVVSGVVAGVLAWLGAASQHSGISFGSLVEAGLNTVPPAIFLIGAGALVHALAPRLVSVAVYGLVGWSFLVELAGSLVKTPRLLLDTSILYHVAPAPATSPHWGSAAVLVLLGLAGATAAAVVFERRDLVNA